MDMPRNTVKDMVHVVLTNKDLKYSSKNKSITAIKLEDFNTLTIGDLMRAHTITFVDEITKLSHSLR